MMGTDDMNEQVYGPEIGLIKRLFHERKMLIEILQGYEEESLAAERGEWVNVDDALPEIGKLVLLQEAPEEGSGYGRAYIGGRTKMGDSEDSALNYAAQEGYGECWLWACAYGSLYLSANGEWAIDDMEQDDIHPVRWCRIPVPPRFEQKENLGGGMRQEVTRAGEKEGR